MMSRLRRALCLLIPAFAATTQAATPTIGIAAPDFSLPDQNGKLRNLGDWRGKWVVLYFYPKDDTPGCTEEACTFRDDLEQLTALNAQVLGISIDTSASHKAFAEKYHLPFPLLADEKAQVAASYGALSDWWVIKLARRYTFLINPKGEIAKAYLSVNTSRHSAEIITDLKQLRTQRSGGGGG